MACGTRRTLVPDTDDRSFFDITRLDFSLSGPTLHTTQKPPYPPTTFHLKH